MENDSIRSSGSNTLVDIWIDGKMRAICVSREAIDAFIGFDKSTGLSDDERCEFVRTKLPLVVTAAKARLRDDPAADGVTIDAGDLPRPDGRSGDRRKGDRRKAERRKADHSKGHHPERRRSNRRQGTRRAKSLKPPEG